MYYELLTRFGYRETQKYGKTDFAISSGIYPNQFHDGRDYAYTNIKNNACKVLLEGKITYVGFGGKYGRAYGNIVEMEIAPNTFLAYCHLDRFLPLAKVGDNRVVGDDIAIIGRSGTSASTGIHVHLLARKNGKTIDPKELVDNSQAQVPTNNNTIMTKDEFISIVRQINRGNFETNTSKPNHINIDFYYSRYTQNRAEFERIMDDLIHNIYDLKNKQGIRFMDGAEMRWRTESDVKGK